MSHILVKLAFFYKSAIHEHFKQVALSVILTKNGQKFISLSQDPVKLLVNYPFLLELRNYGVDYLSVDKDLFVVSVQLWAGVDLEYFIF